MNWMFNVQIVVCAGYLAVLVVAPLWLAAEFIANRIFKPRNVKKDGRRNDLMVGNGRLERRS